jgi:DNA-binding transcriptional ArsR family regulator
VSGRLSEGDWLHAVGHRYRVEILSHLLAEGTATPADIASGLDLPIGIVSYHVRFLAKKGIIRLAGRTQRRGAVVHHYQLTRRERVAALLWGIRAALLVSDFERENGRSDTTVRLDPEALAKFQVLTADFLARIGELGLQTRERRSTDEAQAGSLTQVAVLLATGSAGRAPGATGAPDPATPSP